MILWNIRSILQFIYGMKTLFYLLTISKQFSTSKTKEVIQQYNNTISKLRQTPSKSSHQPALQNVIAQSREKLNKIAQQQKLKEIKEYLAKEMKENKPLESIQEKQEKNKQYIPNKLVVKKLRYFDKKILMLGVQEENEQHCIYLKRMAQKMNTKTLLTALPPDMPYFIKTQLSFLEQWQKFVKIPSKTRQSRFYLNPTPQHISDMCLKENQKQLVRNALNKSKQFNEIFYTIMQNYQQDNVFIPNALLTPLLINCVQQLYFCDYPILKQRQLWALTIPIHKLRQLFEIYHREYHKKQQSHFDPRILFPKSAIARKFQHMSNAIKFASSTSIEPTIFVCPAEYAELFCLEWKKIRSVSPYSDFVIPQGLEPTRFIDFVESLVIMDVILEPVIQKYFVQYWSFPYAGLQTLGGKENIGKIFIVWKHFYNMYTKALKKAPPV